ncbi:MAG TPA: glycosyltransferase [Opitutaceae bacterium]
MDKIGVVIPWFGRGLNGGAERLVWEITCRLAARGHPIEVLTTCCRSHQDDWSENHLPAGLAAEPEGFSVRRFPVEARNRPEFDRVNGRLTAIRLGEMSRGGSPVSASDEAIFADELIRSPELLDYLQAEAGQFRAFIFIPYLYFTTLRGLPLVAAKSILVPCLHQEAYAHLPLTVAAFWAARRILYNAEGERRLAGFLYGPAAIAKGVVAGAGVDYAEANPAEAALDTGALTPFVLCLGRQSPGKNTAFLAQAYAAFRRQHPDSPLKLVLAGPGQVELPPECHGLVNVGAVSEADKLALLKGCTALFNPSVNESYSRVLMEAWHEFRPTAAHRDCLATATAIEMARGGWMAASHEEWAALFATVESAPISELESLGRNGRAYADDMAEWGRAVDRYETAIREVSDPEEARGAEKRPIHQVLPNLTVGDAISGEALWICDQLRRRGHPSKIFALHVHEGVSTVAETWTSGAVPPGCGVIYHHSIGSALTPAVCAHAGPKALIYHNITPESFLAPYLPLNAALCREARAHLPDLARHFAVSVGDSNFNAIELAERGFSNPGVLPLCIDPGKWAMTPNPDLRERLQDQRTNILFVGRLSPNKRQEDLIVAFAHYRKLDPGARLHLVGGAVSSTDLYLSCLRELAAQLGVADCVNFAGAVEDADLMAYYSTAHLFWSMSEHEGFCVPLIEAMWFDVPVLAYASTAVPETLADAGRQFYDKRDAVALAASAHELVHDREIRSQILNRQRRQREAFLPARVAPILGRLADRLATDGTPPKTGTSSAAELQNLKEIAVVKLDHIGDLLLASPAFYALRKRFPGAKLTAVAAPSAAAVLKGNPHVDRIVTYDAPWYWRELGAPEQLRGRTQSNLRTLAGLHRKKFDLVVNLRSDHSNVLFAASIPHLHLLSYTNDSSYAFLVTHPLTRTRGMHATQQHRELLRTIGADEWCPPKIYFSDEEAAQAAEFQPDRSTVALALGAGVGLKRWAPVKFRELARRLRLRGQRVVLVGSAGDARLSEDWAGDLGCIDLCGRLSLNALGAFLSRCGCLAANDSAPMHVGAAAGVPVVYIIRPSVHEEFAPVGEIHIGCLKSSCPNVCQGFDPNNRNGSPEYCECIQSVTVDEVEQAVLASLRRHEGIV